MPFDPSTLTGKVLWVRAKDQTGSSGSTVTSIPDQSGLSHDPTSVSGTTTVTGATPSGGRVLRLSGAAIPLPDLGLNSNAVIGTASSNSSQANNANDGNTSTQW